MADPDYPSPPMSPPGAGVASDGGGLPGLRVSPTCSPRIVAFLSLAASHDVAGLRAAMREAVDGVTPAKMCDLATGETALHAAIRHVSSPQQVPAAEEAVRSLFLGGAIWNALDSADETPGCVARRMGLQSLYALCVEAGVRAEMLFGLIGGYEALESEGDDEDGVVEDEDEEVEEGGEDGGGAEENGLDDFEAALEAVGNHVAQEEAAAAASRGATEEPTTQNGEQEQRQAAGQSTGYLSSTLIHRPGLLLDDDGNAVMMAWEKDIMSATVLGLLGPESGDMMRQAPSSLPDEAALAALDGARGKRILNIGFGLGIVDGLFAATAPAKHHIVEAHASVLSAATSSQGSRFGAAWEAAAPAEGAYRVLPGKWQDVVPRLVERGEEYDAVYFDTFGEDYAQLRLFFTEYVPALLAACDADGRGGGRFSFFNGLGADRQICYDVYAGVAEMHLAEAGLDVQWFDMHVDMPNLGLEREGAGAWESVKRRYWTLDKYKLPICTFLG